MSNTIHSLCPKCNEHIPTLDINDDMISIKCECNYDEAIPLYEFIKQYNDNKDKICTYINTCDEHKQLFTSYCEKCKIHLCEKCKENHEGDHPNINLKDSVDIEEIKKLVKKGEEHLQYLKSLGNKYLDNNQIKLSYEKCYNTSSFALQIINLLIDNYHNDNYNIYDNTKRNCKVNIYKQIDENIKTILFFFDSFHFIKVKELKTIIADDQIIFLFLLKDGRLSTYLRNKIIKIYNPNNDYVCDITIIKPHKMGIRAICQLYDETFVTCSGKEIKFWSISSDAYECLFTLTNPYEDFINKVVSLPNNHLASCSNDKTIKIWNMNKPYNTTAIKIMEGHTNNVTSLKYFKEKNFLISGAYDSTLRIWNMNTYQCVNIVKNVDDCHNNIIYQIDNERFLVGGSTITVLNINNFNIEEKIKNEKIGFISSFVKLRDNNTVICGEETGQFGLFNINTKEYNCINTTHNRYIQDLVNINESIFISCSGDTTLKVWVY